MESFSYRLYRDAIAALAGTNSPPRAELTRIAKLASRLAQREKPWSGVYFYMLLHPDKYPRHRPTGPLLAAVLTLAELPPPEQVVSPAKGIIVEHGAIVLASSRHCTLCGVPFVPAAHQQRYHSLACQGHAAAARKRKARLNRKQPQ